MGKVYCCNCIYYRDESGEFHSSHHCYCPALLKIWYYDYEENAINSTSKTKHIQAGKALDLNSNNACIKYVDKRTKIGKKLKKKVNWFLWED